MNVCSSKLVVIIIVVVDSEAAPWCASAFSLNSNASRCFDGIFAPCVFWWIRLFYVSLLLLLWAGRWDGMRDEPHRGKSLCACNCLSRLLRIDWLSRALSATFWLEKLSNQASHSLFLSPFPFLRVCVFLVPAIPFYSNRFSPVAFHCKFESKSNLNDI